MKAEFKVEGQEYRVHALAAVPALEMAQRVMNITGKSIGALAVADSIKDNNSRAAAFSQAINELAMSVDKRAVELITDLAKTCEIKWNGVWDIVNPNIPEHCPHVGALIELAYQAVLVNYPAFTQAPFIKKMMQAQAEKAAAAKAKAEKQTQE